MSAFNRNFIDIEKGEHSNTNNLPFSASITLTPIRGFGNTPKQALKNLKKAVEAEIQRISKMEEFETFTKKTYFEPAPNGGTVWSTYKPWPRGRKVEEQQ